MAEARELSDEELRQMQLLQLGMVEELDRVCRKHGITYAISDGTLLGAVRHQGYIPWDDDADISMLRSEYEKFKAVAHELDPDICFFQDHSTDPAYRWGYGKLRRTGTVYIRPGQEHVPSQTGVFIDIFPWDGIPKSLPGMVLNDAYCAFLRKATYSAVGKRSADASAAARLAFGLLSRIPIDWVHERFEAMAARYNRQEGGRVRIYAWPALGRQTNDHPLRELYGIPKEWLQNTEDYSFEGKIFRGVAADDDYLKYMYGNYWELPPEDQRHPHTPASVFDIGEALDILKRKGKHL